MSRPSENNETHEKNLIGRFVVLSAVFALVGAVVLEDDFRVRTSEMTLLVTARGEGSARVADTLARLTRTEHFLDRLIERSADAAEILEETLPGARGDSRRTLTGVLDFERLPDSDLVVARATADIPDDARVLVREGAKAFFELSGTVYGDTQEITVRAVDGPITVTAIRTPLLFTVVSVTFGLASAAALLLLFDGVLAAFRFFRERNRFEVARTVSPAPVLRASGKHHITKDIFVPRRPQEIFSIPSEDIPTEAEERAAHPEPEKEDWYEKIAPIIEAPEPPIAAPETAPAPRADVPAGITVPGNLPTADLSSLGISFGEPAEAKQSSEEKSDTMESEPAVASAPAPGERPPLPTEPTVEDYRRRLNELLSAGR